MKIKAGYIGNDEIRDNYILNLLQKQIGNVSSIVVNKSVEKSMNEMKEEGGVKGLMVDLSQGVALSQQDESRQQVEQLSIVQDDSGNKLLGRSELCERLAQNQINLDDVRNEVRAQIYRYIRIFGEIPLHVDALDGIHEIAVFADLIAQIMVQEFGIYEIHLIFNLFSQSDNIMLQIQQFNQVIEIYCLHNIQAVIFFEIDYYKLELGLLKDIIEQLEDYHSCNLRYENYSVDVVDKCSNSSTEHNILIYSKINPATGNQTFAVRLKKMFEMKYKGSRRRVYLRGIDQVNQSEQISIDREILHLSQFIKDKHITICFAINVYRTSTILSQVKSILPFSLVSIIAGTDAYEFLDNHLTSSQMLTACNQSELIVSINQEMKHNFIHQLQIPPSNILVINQSIDLSLANNFSIRNALGMANDEKLILFPAGIRSVKNCKFLIEPIKRLLLKYPNHYFVHVGSILDKKYFNEYMSRMNEHKEVYPTLKNRMIYYGSLDYSSYLGALKESNLVLNCSFSEGQCNSILEAMGSNVLCLISKIEGNLSICEDAQTAVMFEGEEEFISCYNKIFNSEINTQEIIQNAYNKFQKCYAFEIETKGYHDLLSELDQKNYQTLTN